MQLVVLNLAYDAELRTPDELLREFRGLAGWAEATVAVARDEGHAGTEVTVVQRFHRDAVLDRGAVSYRFVADQGPAEPRWWRRSRRALELVAAAGRRAVVRRQPGIVHLHGLGFGAMVPRLRRRLPPQVPIVVQHHGELPASELAGLVQRRGLAAADGFLFAARALADPWRKCGAITDAAPVFEIMEGSTRFCVADRDAARRRSGLVGTPVFLWVGRLDANKDPLTVLAAFEAVLRDLPEARLFMAHGPDSPLRAAVTDRIEASEPLRRSVRLLGTVPHDDMEAVFNSADYFVLGSHREGSGFALAEALACGVVPIVTDIPSFVVMTRDGAVGAVWPPGRPDALAAAIRRTVAQPWDEQSAMARRRFESCLSWPAIGRDAVAAYRAVWKRRAARCDVRNVTRE